MSTYTQYLRQDFGRVDGKGRALGATAEIVDGDVPGFWVSCYLTRDGVRFGRRNRPQQTVTRDGAVDLAMVLLADLEASTRADHVQCV